MLCRAACTPVPLRPRRLLRLAGEGTQNVDGVLSPADVAAAVVDALDRESFLVLPHPQVLGYMQNKTGNYDRWIGGMVKLRRRYDQG